MASRDAVVMFVHFVSPELQRHIARLRREAQGVVDVFVAFNIGTAKALPPGAEADIIVSLDKCAALQPRRFAEYRTHNLDSIYHFADLLMMGAMGDPLVSRYEHVWFVEYDVDYSGNWANFFRRCASYEEDLLGAHMRTRSDFPGFDHWFWYEQPDWVSIEPVRGFYPISRFSRRMIETVLAELEKPGWKGHFELVYPSLARAFGLTVGDLGNRGEFTPPERVGQNYLSIERTHRFRPPRAYAYFGDEPQRYRFPERIHHPVKAEWTRRQRVKAELESLWSRANIHLPPLVWARKLFGTAKARPKTLQ